jgi:hypothetical protein
VFGRDIDLLGLSDVFEELLDDYTVVVPDIPTVRHVASSENTSESVQDGRGWKQC